MLTRKYIFKKGIYSNNEVLADSKNRTITYLIMRSTVSKMFFSRVTLTNRSKFQQKFGKEKVSQKRYFILIKGQMKGKINALN